MMYASPVEDRTGPPLDGNPWFLSRRPAVAFDYARFRRQHFQSEFGSEHEHPKQIDRKRLKRQFKSKYEPLGFAKRLFGVKD